MPDADRSAVRSVMVSAKDFLALICFVSRSRTVVAEPLYLPSLVAIRNQLNAFANLKSCGKEAFITNTGINAFRDGNKSLDSTPYSRRFLMTEEIASFVLRQQSSNVSEGSQKDCGTSFSLALPCPMIARVLTTTPG